MIKYKIVSGISIITFKPSKDIFVYVKQIFMVCNLFKKYTIIFANNSFDYVIIFTSNNVKNLLKTLSKYHPKKVDIVIYENIGYNGPLPIF